MTCALTDQLDAYLDGDLAPRDARQFEAHAEGCPACADELALAQRLQGALRALPSEACPYDVYQGALDRIAREKRDRPAAASAAASAAAGRARRPRWQAVGLGVAFVVLATLAFLLLRPSAETVPGERVAETQQPEEIPSDPEGPAPDPVTPPAADSPEPPAPETQAPPQARTPTPAPQAAPPREVAAVAPPTPPPPETEAIPDEAEVEAAREGVMLAFSLFAEANRQATKSVRTNVGHGLDYVTEAFTILR